MLLILSSLWSVSVDCPNVIALAYSLKLDVAQPTMMTALLTNCCGTLATTGTTCVSTRVTVINWSSKQLTGVLNASLALPPNLVTLNIGTNTVTGDLSSWTLPTPMVNLNLFTNKLSGDLLNLALPSGLKILGLYNNKFNGSAPALPSGLTSMQIYMNSFTGSLPAPSSTLTIYYAYSNEFSGTPPRILSPVMVYYAIYDNYLTGTFTDQVWPSTLKYLYLSQNLFTGGVSSLSNTALIDCWLYINAFSGPVPAFPATAKNVYIGYPGYPGNSFTGTIELEAPLGLYINDNLLTDVIIHNTASLSNCDLSNNPLLGSANLGMLSMCQQNGLYAPPSTLSTSAFQTTEALSISEIETTEALSISEIETTEALSISEIETTEAPSISEIETTEALSISEIETTEALSISEIQTTEALSSSETEIKVMTSQNPQITMRDISTSALALSDYPVDKISSSSQFLLQLVGTTEFSEFVGNGFTTFSSPAAVESSDPIQSDAAENTTDDSMKMVTQSSKSSQLSVKSMSDKSSTRRVSTPYESLSQVELNADVTKSTMALTKTKHVDTQDILKSYSSIISAVESQIESKSSFNQMTLGLLLILIL